MSPAVRTFLEGIKKQVLAKGVETQTVPSETETESNVDEMESQILTKDMEATEQVVEDTSLQTVGPIADEMEPEKVMTNEITEREANALAVMEAVKALRAKANATEKALTNGITDEEAKAQADEKALVKAVIDEEEKAHAAAKTALTNWIIDEKKKSQTVQKALTSGIIDEEPNPQATTQTIIEETNPEKAQPVVENFEARDKEINVKEPNPLAVPRRARPWETKTKAAQAVVEDSGVQSTQAVVEKPEPQDVTQTILEDTKPLATQTIVGKQGPQHIHTIVEEPEAQAATTTVLKGRRPQATQTTVEEEEPQAIQTIVEKTKSQAATTTIVEDTKPQATQKIVGKQGTQNIHTIVEEPKAQAQAATTTVLKGKKPQTTQTTVEEEDPRVIQTIVEEPKPQTTQTSFETMGPQAVQTKSKSFKYDTTQELLEDFRELFSDWNRYLASLPEYLIEESMPKIEQIDADAKQLRIELDNLVEWEDDLRNKVASDSYPGLKIHTKHGFESYQDFIKDVNSVAFCRLTDNDTTSLEAFDHFLKQYHDKIQQIKEKEQRWRLYMRLLQMKEFDAQKTVLEKAVRILMLEMDLEEAIIDERDMDYFESDMVDLDNECQWELSTNGSEETGAVVRVVEEFKRDWQQRQKSPVKQNIQRSQDSKENIERRKVTESDFNPLDPNAYLPEHLPLDLIWTTTETRNTLPLRRKVTESDFNPLDLNAYLPEQLPFDFVPKTTETRNMLPPSDLSFHDNSSNRSASSPSLRERHADARSRSQVMAKARTIVQSTSDSELYLRSKNDTVVPVYSASDEETYLRLKKDTDANNKLVYGRVGSRSFEKGRDSLHKSFSESYVSFLPFEEQDSDSQPLSNTKEKSKRVQFSIAEKVDPQPEETLPSVYYGGSAEKIAGPRYTDNIQTKDGKRHHLYTLYPNPSNGSTDPASRRNWSTVECNSENFAKGYSVYY